MQKIQTLIVGRLLIVFLLFVIKWIWNSEHAGFSLASYPRGIFSVLLIIIGLTGIYFLASRLINNYVWQIRIQLFLDALLITWLIWRSGDITSPFISLFIIIISVSSVFLRSRDTVVMTLICVLLFTLLAGLAHEIRNPLGAMRGAIQVMQINTPPESSQASLMDIILRESDRLNKIISNFLSYARPRVTNFSEIDVREAIDDTFMLLKHSPDILDHHELETDQPKIRC